MKNISILAATLMCMVAFPALAHVGPEAIEQHFIEHILIALIVGLPVGYALLRWYSRADKNSDSKF